MKKILSILLCALTVVSLNSMDIKATESNRFTKISNVQRKEKNDSSPVDKEKKTRKGERLPIVESVAGTGIRTFSADSAEKDDDIAGRVRAKSDGSATYSTNSAERNGKCGTNVTWKLKDGVLTVSGNGVMDDYVIVADWITGEIIESETHRSPWEQYKNDIKEVYIEDGVTSVGSSAFSDCSYLKKVVIGNSVKTIKWDAFSNDTAITDFTLGNSVETIGDDALYGIGIKNLTLPSSIKELTNYSLIGLWKLESISISGNNTYTSADGILYADGGKTLFLYPSARFGEYRIPSNVTKIAEDAFIYSSLTKIVIPDTVKEIGNGAFEYSDNLKVLVFGKGITVIPESCCYYNRSLTSVTVPEGIKTVGQYAFWICTSLKSIVLPRSVIQVENAFEANTQIEVLNPNLIRLEDGSFICGFHVNVEAKELYKNAFEVLNLVNKERRKAGVSDLVMDQSLLETAMSRGFENVVYWSHTRPNGTDCFTANDKMMGENIAVNQETPEEVMQSWMSSEGHRANILSSDYKSIGIGCVYVDGTYYWVQCFGTDEGKQALSYSYTDRNNHRSVLIKKDKEYYNAYMDISSRSLKVGQTASVIIRWNGNQLVGSGAIITSSNPSVCSVSGEKLIAKKAGTANITMYYKGYPEAAQTIRVTVKASTDNSKTKKKNVEASTGNSKIKKKKIKVSKATIRKLRNKKGKKIVISINKISKVKGYQIVYAANKKFQKASKITTGKSTVTISKLKKKKMYYIKVRAYKTDSDGKKVFGAFSKVKKIMVRK